MTKDNDDLAKQQVLFNDIDTVVEQAATSFKENPSEANVTAQVVFDNDDYLPLMVDSTELSSELQSELNNEHLYQDVNVVQGNQHSWLWRIILISFFSLLCIETVEFFTLGFEQSPIITGIYALLLLSITMVASNSLWREYVGLKQFNHAKR